MSISTQNDAQTTVSSSIDSVYESNGTVGVDDSITENAEEVKWLCKSSMTYVKLEAWFNSNYSILAAVATEGSFLADETMRWENIVRLLKTHRVTALRDIYIRMAAMLSERGLAPGYWNPNKGRCKEVKPRAKKSSTKNGVPDRFSVANDEAFARKDEGFPIVSLAADLSEERIYQISIANADKIRGKPKELLDWRRIILSREIDFSQVETFDGYMDVCMCKNEIERMYDLWFQTRNMLNLVKNNTNRMNGIESFQKSSIARYLHNYVCLYMEDPLDRHSARALSPTRRTVPSNSNYVSPSGDPVTMQFPEVGIQVPAAKTITEAYNDKSNNSLQRKVSFLAIGLVVNQIILDHSSLHRHLLWG